MTATDYISSESENYAQEKNIVFKFMPSRESLVHKKTPRENAFYRFEMEGIKIAHLGDVGNKLSERQQNFLEGVDLLIAPTGGPPTIDLDDLYETVQKIKPKIVIPMHYKIPGPKFHMFPVEEFLNMFDPI